MTVELEHIDDRMINELIATLHDPYWITWDIEWESFADVKELEKAINAMCHRAISFSVIVKERRAVWAQSFPPTHGRRIVNTVDYVAQVMARRYNITLNNPRLM